MKRILFLSCYLPKEAGAAEKNTKIMLRSFPKDMHVDLVYYRYKADTLYEPESDNVSVIKMYQITTGRKILNALMMPFLYPLFSVRFNIFQLRWINKQCRENHYDAIVCDHSQMFLFGKYLDKNALKILVSHDVIYQRIARDSKSALKRKWCLWSEKFCLKVENSQVFTFSQKDCDLLTNLYGVQARCSYDYIDERIIESDPSKKTDDFVMLGNWGRKDNLEGALWLINTALKDIGRPCKIHIIGSKFKDEYITNDNPNLKVINHGFIDNPYPLIAGSKALLSPLFTGAGIKVKVLEALACGIPVIGTEIAFEGIPKEFASFMIMAKTPEEYDNSMKSVNRTDIERKEFKEKFIKVFRNEMIPEYLESK